MVWSGLMKNQVAHGVGFQKAFPKVDGAQTEIKFGLAEDDSDWMPVVSVGFKKSLIAW